MGSRNTFNPTFQSSVFAGAGEKPQFKTSNHLFFSITKPSLEAYTQPKKNDHVDIGAAGSKTMQEINLDKKRFTKTSPDNMFIEPVHQKKIEKVNQLEISKPAVGTKVCQHVQALMQESILAEQDYVKNYKNSLDNQVEEKRAFLQKVRGCETKYNPSMASLQIVDKKNDHALDLSKTLLRQMEEKQNAFKSETQRELESEQKYIQRLSDLDVTNKKKLINHELEEREKYAELRKEELTDKLLRKKENKKVEKDLDERMTNDLKQKDTDDLYREKEHVINIRNNYSSILNNQIKEKMQREKLKKELELKSELERIEVIRSYTQAAKILTFNEEIENMAYNKDEAIKILSENKEKKMSTKKERAESDRATLEDCISKNKEFENLVREKNNLIKIQYKQALQRQIDSKVESKNKTFNDNIDNEKQFNGNFTKLLGQDNIDSCQNASNSKLALKNLMFDQYQSSQKYRLEKRLEEKDYDKKYMESKINEAKQHLATEESKKRGAALSISNTLAQMRSSDYLKRKQISDNYIGRTFTSENRPPSTPGSARKLMKDLNVGSRVDGQCIYKANEKECMFSKVSELDSKDKMMSHIFNKRERIGYDHRFKSNLRPNLYNKRML